MADSPQRSAIDPQEFGRFQGSIEATLNNLTGAVEKMDKKIDKLVTHEQLESQLVPIRETLKSHDRAIKSHDDTLNALHLQDTLERASLWTKIKAAFEGNFVKSVSTALFIVAIVVVVYYIAPQYRPQPQDVINITQ